MHRCTVCKYTVKTPPVPRTCPQCGEANTIRAIQLKDIAVTK